MTQEQSIENQEPSVIPSEKQPKVVNITQERMDEIIQTAKIAAYEKGKNDGASLNQTQQPQPQQQQQQQGVPGNDLNALIAQETQRHLDKLKQSFEQSQMNQAGQKLANDFYSKISAASEEHPDLESKIGSMPLQAFPHTIALSIGFDNTADLMKEFADNPIKMDRIESLAQRDPTGELAYMELKKLSDSIKTNKEAKNINMGAEPLSHIKSSNHGIDNGSAGLTVSDFRKMFK